MRCPGRGPLPAAPSCGDTPPAPGQHGLSIPRAAVGKGLAGEELGQGAGDPQREGPQGAEGLAVVWRGLTAMTAESPILPEAGPAPAPGSLCRVNAEAQTVPRLQTWSPGCRQWQGQGQLCRCSVQSDQLGAAAPAAWCPPPSQQGRAAASSFHKGGTPSPGAGPTHLAVHFSPTSRPALAGPPGPSCWLCVSLS